MFHGSEIQHVSTKFEHGWLSQSWSHPVTRLFCQAASLPSVQEGHATAVQVPCNFAGFMSLHSHIRGSNETFLWRHDATCLTDLNLHSPIIPGMVMSCPHFPKGCAILM